MPRKMCLSDFEERAVRKSAPYALAHACLVYPSVNPQARHVYQLRHGVKLSPEVCVLHRCDVPHCIEDSHHFLGSQWDNQRDAYAKGRHAIQQPNEARSKGVLIRIAARKGKPGRIPSEETRARMSAAQKGRTREPCSQQTKDKISNSVKLLFQTEQGEAIRAKLRAAWIRRKARK